MFFVVFPYFSNINAKNPASQKVLGQENNLSEVSINVDIPCSGHAPLIIDEIKKNISINLVIFKNPNSFDIEYDSKLTSPEKILALDIFKTYPARIN